MSLSHNDSSKLPAAPETIQPLSNSTKGQTFTWNFFKIIKSRVVILLMIFTCFCAVVVNSPHFQGTVDLKIQPSGIEFHIDRR